MNISIEKEALDYLNKKGETVITVEIINAGGG